MPRSASTSLAAALAALATTATPALARRSDEGPLLSFGGDPVRVEVPLRATAAATHVGHVDTDAAATTPETDVFLETRLRLGVDLHVGDFLDVFSEADIAAGRLAGEPDLDVRRPPHRSVRWFDLRKLYVEANTGFALIRGGHQTSHWGMGLVANDGDRGYGFGTMRFGWPQRGDIVERLLIATRPLAPLSESLRPFVAAIGGDYVYRDDNASIFDGDQALQAVLSLAWSPDSERSVGFYGVMRFQEDGDGDRLDVAALDLAGRWPFELGPGSLVVAAEAALIVGKATVAATTDVPEHHVRQLGITARVGYLGETFGALVDGGWMSGDQNPYDDRLEGFRADPDFQVGLLLFKEALGWQSARASYRAADPDLVGLPSHGSERISTLGGVAGAAWVFPKLRYRPLDWLELFGGPLLAWSTVELTDPFNTRVAGGVNRNFLGGNGGRFLGTEVDLGVGFNYQLGPVALSASLQGGVFVPGDALKHADGEVLDALGGALLLVDVKL
jgi:hypothetical protein